MVVNAKSANDDIYRLPHGDATFSEGPIVYRAFQSQNLSSHRHEGQSTKKAFRDSELLIVFETLKNFGQNQITH